jgi:hypothetical protein
MPLSPGSINVAPVPTLHWQGLSKPESEMVGPVVYIAERIMDTTSGMVCLALRFRRHQGATAKDLSDYVNARIPSEHRLHAGLVERVLSELHSEGLVSREGERWFPGSVTA